MRQTGRYSSFIEDPREFDIDHKINEAVSNTKTLIQDLKDELSSKDFKLVIKAIATELIESL